MGFFEVFWDGEAIGDGSDLEEALTAYLSVQPEDISWAEACAAASAPPCIRRYASFEAYLDNADEQETITVTAAMIEAAFARHGLHFFSLFLPEGTPLFVAPLVAAIEFLSFLSCGGIRLMARELSSHDDSGGNA